MPGANNKQYNTMTDTNNNTEKKLRFSELKGLLKADGFDVDVPGLVLAIDLHGTSAQWSDTGLEKGHEGSLKLPLLAVALPELVRQVMMDEPKALALVAELYGQRQQIEAKRDALLGVFADFAEDNTDKE